MAYEISLAQRKVILLNHRVEELLSNGERIREGDGPSVFLVEHSSGELTIVDDAEDPDTQSAKNPEDGIAVTRAQLADWAAGNVTANLKGKIALDGLVRALWPVPESVKDEDKEHMEEGSAGILLNKWEDEKQPGPISDDGIGRMEFATGIGFTCARARYVLDIAYQTKPSFHVFAMKATQANNFYKVHGGAYFVYRVENTKWTHKHGFCSGIVIKSTLVMRYPVPYKTFSLEEKDNYFRIHCKYIIPQISDKSGKIVYKYDGYCAPGRKNNGSWQWLFQQRQSVVKEQQSDILMMYTGEFVPRSKYTDDSLQWVDGDVLTEYQGKRQGARKSHVSSRVIMVRAAGYESRVVDGSEEKYGTPHIALHKMQDDGSFTVENEHVFMRRHSGIFDLGDDGLEFNSYDDLAIRRLLVRS